MEPAQLHPTGVRASAGSSEAVLGHTQRETAATRSKNEMPRQCKVLTVRQPLSRGAAESKLGLSPWKFYIRFQVPLVLSFDMVVALATQHLAVTK